MTQAAQRITRASLLLLALHPAVAATRYVDLNSANPTPPFTNWATAAAVIQDAVDAAGSGDEVLVTNGVYATGGRAVEGTMTNRVAVTKPVTLRSVNGPEMTVIEGYQVPGTTNGDGAIRCVYLADRVVLSGFTLTRGATRKDYLSRQQCCGGGIFSESTNVWVTNCLLTANSAAGQGGGAYLGTLHNCTLARNSTSGSTGGGAYGGVLNNCALIRNSAYGRGCRGGGASSSILNNCTLSLNHADSSGGGASESALNNCILYDNDTDLAASPNYGGGTLNFCCTTPLPADGLGNIDVDPGLASAFRISVTSLCRGAGSGAYATGVDIDGEPWLSPPSLGCDEYRTEAITGDVWVAIAVVWTNVAVGVALDLVAEIRGRVSASVWDFGDGTMLTNRPSAKHAWVVPGDYPVLLTAYNDSHPGGVSAAVGVRVSLQPVHYVSAASTNPTPPYTSWEAASSTLQDAVDAVTVPGALVLVTNGVYALGGRALVDTTAGWVTSNRVAVTKPLTLRSLNGPLVTVIEGTYSAGPSGTEAVRCAYLANAAVLSGFTLTRGMGGVACKSANEIVTNCLITASAGSGASRGTLSDCTLTGNGGGGAWYGVLNRCTLMLNGTSTYGGGAYSCTLNHCVLSRNHADEGAGGAFGCTLNNCILTDNSANEVGGAWQSTLINCIVYYNHKGGGWWPDSDNYAGCALNHCCTWPLPTDGVGNITNEPAFVDLDAGDFRLQAGSPCVNAGNNAYVSETSDLDGNPRIVGGTVDIGAYEFQTPTSLLSYAWAQQYGLPTDGSADFTDNDADLLNNWQEWRAGTIPTNALSVLRLLTPASDGTNLTVTWESVTGRSYFLERSAEISNTSAFTRFATNIQGQASTTFFVDTNVVGASPRFYRVGLQ